MQSGGEAAWTSYSQGILAVGTALLEKRRNHIRLYVSSVFFLCARASVTNIRNIDGFMIDITDDHGYIETKTCNHKCANLSNSFKLSLLMVAPISDSDQQHRRNQAKQ